MSLWTQKRDGSEQWAAVWRDNLSFSVEVLPANETNSVILVGSISNWLGRRGHEKQLSEVMTHLAFYAGWPNAITAVGVARGVLGEMNDG